MRTAAGVPLLALLLAGTGCRAGEGASTPRGDSLELAKREAHLARTLAQPDSTATRDAPLARWLLESELAEISGLALTTDGRLLTHEDETGTVFEVDYRRGRIVKRFTLGTPVAHGDFEGITVANDTVYMLTSHGRLFEFREGTNGETVPFTVHDTGLQHACEFEGVVFDPALHALLFACKVVHTEGALRDSLVLYRWKLPSENEPRPTRLTVPLTRIIGSNGWAGLHPSDITIDPVSGNYVLVAGEESALIELTPAGDVVFARPLPAGLEHAEGVAITTDHILIISTEARRRSAAAITLYRWP